MTKINVQNLNYEIDNALILKNISIVFSKSELIVVVGPNGAGKSAFLKCIAGVNTSIIRPQDADCPICYDGTPISHMSPLERAQKIAYLPQQRKLEWPVLVKDVVALGRFAFGGSITAPMGEDQKAIDNAIAHCSIDHLIHRRTDTLSGGELARVHCARTFAAQASTTLFDEPVAALDPKHQLEIMQIIRQNVDQGQSAIVVLHDLALAARFADRIVWLNNGQIAKDGSVKETLTVERVREVFGISAQIDLGKRPTISYE